MIKRMKRKLSFILSNTHFYKYLVLLNLFLFHFNEREHKVSFDNKNPEKIFYIIRPRGNTEGLISCYLGVYQEVKYANKCGYIPIVDYKNFDNQYLPKEQKGLINTWNLFFEPVSQYSLDEVYQSKCVIFSGWTIKKVLFQVDKSNFKEKLEYYRNITKKLNLKKEIIERAAKLEDEYINDKTLGLFLRGTDYILLEPKGHYRQPSIECVLDKINEYMKKYNFDKIFLVTEDEQIVSMIRQNIKIPVQILGKNMIKEYDGKDYISNYLTEEEKYMNALNYLMRIILLSKCHYLISSITSATFLVSDLGKESIKDYFFFDLGKY